MNLSNCRIVLVRPVVAGNIGAVARLMRNFGLDDIVLVAPVADPDSYEARQRSTHGESILRSARRVATLADGVSDCLVVAGTSARSAGLVRQGLAGSPDEIAPKLIRQMDQGKVAMVFGPEPDGL